MREYLDGLNPKVDEGVKIGTFAFNNYLKRRISMFMLTIALATAII